MANIDDLFQNPNAALKRKLEEPSSSFLAHHKQQSNKIAKVQNGDSPHTLSNGKGGRVAAVVDVVMDDADDDIEAGPALPPTEGEGDLDEDEEEDDDEEGRFFGGGVSKQERDVMDYIDKNEDTTFEEKIDSAWLRKTAISFERKINKNAEMRAKYEDEPIKFVASEADLDAEIKSLGVLSEHIELYQEFTKLGCVGSLVGLLAHENTDIAISTCELLAELTEDNSSANGAQWQILVKAMIKADVVDLMVSNLQRLDESNENDQAGVYHVLNVMENLMSDTGHLTTIGASHNLLTWLQKRINTPDKDARAKVGQNRQYAAEILAILLQGSLKTRQAFINADGIESLLQLLSFYRKEDPEDNSDEEEFVENLFDCLVSAVKDPVGIQKFIEGEGVELCLIMIRAGKLSKSRAIRVLDHACDGPQGIVVGEHIIEAGGLKPIFTMFMKDKKRDQDTTEHLLDVFASLLRQLPSESAARIRLLAKFVEKSYEKVVRLLEMRNTLSRRIASVENEIQTEQMGLTQEESEQLQPGWLSRRFDAGLFSLQMIDVILAWLIAEDQGIKKKITNVLAEEKLDLDIIRASLQVQKDRIDPVSGRDTKDMIESLLRFL